MLNDPQNAECESVLEVIRNNAKNANKTDPTESNDINNNEQKHDKPSACHNYCVHGTCLISSTGYAKCECPAGYTGERCENDLCNGYCLNDGRCNIENNEPNCQCPESFLGRHCETMTLTEMCTRYCANEDVETGGLDLSIVCVS